MSETRTILNRLNQLQEADSSLPALFIGHGSPMNAIEDNEFSSKWIQIGKELPQPKAILCISAHWETAGTKITVMHKPRTIHDFSGFPDALFTFQYPAAGAPEIAKMTAKEINKTTVEPDQEWGLDHGSWSVLCRMYPKADVPCFQLSLDYTKPPQYHYELAKELQHLRKKGVLIIGSGNMVHNLRLMRLNTQAFDWASEFDMKIAKLIEDGDHEAIINFRRFGTMADLSVPSMEHYLPMLYTLALQQKNETISFFNEKNVFGSISMRSFTVA